MKRQIPCSRKVWTTLKVSPLPITDRREHHLRAIMCSTFVQVSCMNSAAACKLPTKSHCNRALAECEVLIASLKRIMLTGGEGEAGYTREAGSCHLGLLGEAGCSEEGSTVQYTGHLRRCCGKHWLFIGVHEQPLLCRGLKHHGLRNTLGLRRACTARIRPWHVTSVGLQESSGGSEDKPQPSSQEPGHTTLQAALGHQGTLPSAVLPPQGHSDDAGDRA